MYTIIIGKTKSFKSLNLKSPDFCLCVEIPNNAKKHLHSVKKETWEYLSQKANNTYVPETTLSRNSGAGAGLLDND